MAETGFWSGKSGLESRCLTLTLIKGSLTMSMDAEVAQVVEHGTENAGVASSTLALGTAAAPSRILRWP